MVNANAIYATTAWVAVECHSRGILFSVENPTRSHFWGTSAWQGACHHIGAPLTTVDFQNCAFGGKRPKWTRLAGNFRRLSSLRRLCDGTHEHLPWGLIPQSSGRQTFATTGEAEYPLPLCRAIATTVQEELSARGRIPPQLGVPSPRHPSRLPVLPLGPSPKLLAFRPRSPSMPQFSKCTPLRSLPAT